jgi:hypothetical protein
MKLKLRKGWRSDTSVPSVKAIDQDGLCWYGGTGQWILNVPWFRRSKECPEHWNDDIAVVESIHGKLEYPITQKGTILVGKRRIRSTQWNH